MELNNDVLQIWNLLAAFLISNAVFFAALAFLIWVGFRLSNNIYNAPETPVVGKAMASLFCLSVATFTFGNLSTFNAMLKDTATVFAAMQEQGVFIGSAAENLISVAGDAPVLNLMQVVFIGSVVIMQMAQIWIKRLASD